MLLDFSVALVAARSLHHVCIRLPGDLEIEPVKLAAGLDPLVIVHITYVVSLVSAEWSHFIVERFHLVIQLIYVCLHFCWYEFWVFAHLFVLRSWFRRHSLARSQTAVAVTYDGLVLWAYVIVDWHLQQNCFSGLVWWRGFCLGLNCHFLHSGIYIFGAEARGAFVSRIGVLRWALAREWYISFLVIEWRCIICRTNWSWKRHRSSFRNIFICSLPRGWCGVQLFVGCITHDSRDTYSQFEIF